MKHYFIPTVSFFCSLLISCSLNTESAKNPYLGLKPPGLTPEIFAKGIVSTEINNHSPAIFSKNGKDLFWSYYSDGNHVIMHMEEIKGTWSNPKKFMVSDSGIINGNPFYTADFSCLVFFSNRGKRRKDGTPDFNLWYIKKDTYGWSKPKPFNSPPNTENWEFYGSQANNGNFYLTRKLNERSMEFQLFISKFNHNNWEEPILMSDIFNSSKVNWTPYIAPDESYLIFSSDREGKTNGYDACDLFISFKDTENKWCEPINMGKEINTNEIERFPLVSPDGKYLFFVRGFGNIYWVSTDVIKRLKPHKK